MKQSKPPLGYAQLVHSKAIEVIGSLNLTPPCKDPEEWARQQGYLAVFHAIVLFERALGKSSEDLARRYKIENWKLER